VQILGKKSISPLIFCHFFFPSLSVVPTTQPPLSPTGQSSASPQVTSRTTNRPTHVRKSPLPVSLSPLPTSSSLSLSLSLSQRFLPLPPIASASRRSSRHHLWFFHHQLLHKSLAQPLVDYPSSGGATTSFSLRCKLFFFLHQ